MLFPNAVMFKEEKRQMKSGKPIPVAVLHRITKYFRWIKVQNDEGHTWVSSKKIAAEFGLNSSTVRQDLSYSSFSGMAKRGYETARLLQALEQLLGMNMFWNVVVAGADHVGVALASHKGLRQHGFHVCGLFDNDPEKVGMKIEKLTVRPLAEMPQVVQSENAKIGIIIGPPSIAKKTAECMVESGLLGLLNMTSVSIQVPKDICMVEAQFISHLQMLAHQIVMRGQVRQA
jgi:redox-sensing transcriptional repressor